MMDMQYFVKQATRLEALVDEINTLHDELSTKQVMGEKLTAEEQAQWKLLEHLQSRLS